MVDYIKRQMGLLSTQDSKKTESKPAPPFQFSPSTEENTTSTTLASSGDDASKAIPAVPFPVNRLKKEAAGKATTPKGGSKPSPVTSTSSSSATSKSGGGSSVITQVSKSEKRMVFGGFDYSNVVPPPEPEPGTYIPLLPTKDPSLSTRNTLVLDLDETLVHSSFKPLFMADWTIHIEIEGDPFEVSIRKRPHVEAFLQKMCQIYEVVVLTASLPVYADPVMDLLDPTKTLIHHRLFRDSCANFNGNYVKDLSYLGRPMKTIIIIDNSPLSYMFQPKNALPITSWFDDISDRELKDLMPALEEAATVEDVLPVLEKHRQKLEASSPKESSPTRKFW